MASLTIDQLKKSLLEQGIALPPSGSKKADYVRLYKQYSTLNENLGDFYSSDDENPPRNSQPVTSSSSPSKVESIIKEVERLTDDELYNQLKELGASIGPVLKNTRKVYEKKLVKILGSSSQTNGVDTSSHKISNSFKVDEFSDSEVDLPSAKSSYKKIEPRDSFEGRKTSLNKESPKPSVEESISEPALERRCGTNIFSELDNKNSFGNYSRESSSKISFIETIPKGSTFRYIERAPEVEFSNTFRSRFSSEKPDSGPTEYYTGTWEPNIKKYYAPQQYKSFKRPTVMCSNTSYKENITAVVIVLAFIFLILYLYFYQWSAADPYKEIEDAAERELEHLELKNDDVS